MIFIPNKGSLFPPLWNYKILEVEGALGCVTSVLPNPNLSAPPSRVLCATLAFLTSHSFNLVSDPVICWDWDWQLGVFTLVRKFTVDFSTINTSSNKL